MIYSIPTAYAHHGTEGEVIVAAVVPTAEVTNEVITPESSMNFNATVMIIGLVVLIVVVLGLYFKKKN